MSIGVSYTYHYAYNCIVLYAIIRPFILYKLVYGSADQNLLNTLNKNIFFSKYFQCLFVKNNFIRYNNIEIVQEYLILHQHSLFYYFLDSNVSI